MSDLTHRDPHVKAPVNLTLEEIKVLKECRVNSIYYRGLPLGVLSALGARGAIQTGYFPILQRWSKAVYAGVFGLGFFSGILSYREICFHKIMSLENSTLKDQFLEIQKQSKVGNLGTSEFSDDKLESQYETRVNQLKTELQKADDDDGSPLMRRIQERSKWDDIRQQSRQTPNERGGLSYEELRRKNRERKTADPKQDQEGEKQHQAPMDFESFSQPTYIEEKSSHALNFSSDDNVPLSLYPAERKNEQEAQTTGTKRRTYNQATGRKNQYGDEME